tara:strand:+ start:650 stop:805 length:156 start_codon:yes stop_codon:yes gene_type:complete
MPYGKGTYGNQVGRPSSINPTKKTSSLKNEFTKRSSMKRSNPKPPSKYKSM